MIKKGDKVICIKNHTYHSKMIQKSGICAIYSYSIGKEYLINSVYNYEYSTGFYIDSDVNIEKSYCTGLNFYAFKPEHKRETNLRIFDEYFVTLAEWRELQLNSILDETNL